MRVAVYRQRETVMVEVPAVVIGEVDVPALEIDLQCADLVLLADLDDFFGHRRVLRVSVAKKGLPSSDRPPQALQPWSR